MRHTPQHVTHTVPHAISLAMRILHWCAPLGAALLIGIAASIKIPLPFTPVPITLQTLVLCTAAALLQRHRAVQMALWYVGLGIAGAPWFAGGAAGWGVIAGATGGYLVGFIIAAAWIGYLQPQVRTVWQQVALFASASALIFLCGATWLAVVGNLSALQALTAGVLPFLPGDAIKIAAATSIMRALKK